MKKLLCIIAAIVLVPLSAGASLYSYTETKELTKGVTHTNVKKFFGDSALNVDCVCADLTNPHISMKLLKSAYGCDKALTVDALATTREGVVAASNADFFSYYKGSQYFSLGLEIKDGKLLQSHIKPNMAAGIVSDGVLSLGYIDFSVSVELNEKSLPVSHINKPTDYYGALLMYTPEFNGGVSPFFPEGISVVTVTDSVVTAKGVSMGGTVPIPENGYLLAIDDNMTPILDINTNVGDSIKANIKCTPSIEKADTAFGGGTMLLKDGKKTKITHAVNGYNPRTAVGTSDNGTKVYIIAVDGRQGISKGATLEELADICLELGCNDAMNLDGGSSTKLVGKTLENPQIHTINSPTNNERVISGIAFVSDAKQGDVAGFKLKAEKEYVLSGDSVDIAVTPFDENGNPPKDFNAQCIWELNGEGTVTGNTYHASGSGTAVLSYYCNGVFQSSVSVNIMDEIAGIDTLAKIGCKKDAGIDLTQYVKVFDKAGNTAEVKDISVLNPVYDPSMVQINGNILKCKQEGASVVTLSYKDVVRSFKVICERGDCPMGTTTIKDSKNFAGGKANLRIMAQNSVNTLFGRLCYRQSAQIFAGNGDGVYVGGKIAARLTPEGFTPVTTQGYGVHHIQNACVITLVQDKNTLGKTQWNALATELSKIKEKNVIIVMGEMLNLTNTLENRVFYDVMKNTAAQKNVFVVSNGEDDHLVIRDNVRYLYLADCGDYATMRECMEKQSYAAFCITPDDITYSFEKLFK